MALPDLDPAEISWIAFWNNMDNGASDIDPIEAASGFDSYQEYTNGIQGEVTFGGYSSKSRTFRARVKDDGWFVVWLDRTAQEGVSTGWIDGPYDIVFDWTNDDDSDTIVPSAHSNVIQSLHSELSNSGAASFSHSDVGLYNYEAPDSTTISLFSSTDYNFSSSLTPSSSTTLHYGWLTASATAADNSINWDGVATIDPRGARNVVGRGEVQAGSTSSVSINRNQTQQNSHATIVLGWS